MNKENTDKYARLLLIPSLTATMIRGETTTNKTSTTIQRGKASNKVYRKANESNSPHQTRSKSNRNSRALANLDENRTTRSNISYRTNLGRNADDHQSKTRVDGNDNALFRSRRKPSRRSRSETKSYMPLKKLFAKKTSRRSKSLDTLLVTDDAKNSQYDDDDLRVIHDLIMGCIFFENMIMKQEHFNRQIVQNIIQIQQSYQHSYQLTNHELCFSIKVIKIEVDRMREIIQDRIRK